MRKIERFRKLDCTVQVLWECEFQQRGTNTELKDFVRNLNLEPRHGFFGGRTNACRNREAANVEKIHYEDFNPLYPHIIDQQVL